MVTKTTIVKNHPGLHARPAALFTQAASKFESKILISRVGSDKKANAKSIMMLLSLSISQGEQVEISAEGTDEQEAVDYLIELIDKGLGENN